MSSQACHSQVDQLFQGLQSGLPAFLDKKNRQNQPNIDHLDSS